MATDFSVMKNRSNITDMLIRRQFTNEQIVHICIRLLTYMECRTPHPDRQEFWEYLEKIIKEKEQVQLSLQSPEEQIVTETGEIGIIKNRPFGLDKDEKVVLD